MTRDFYRNAWYVDVLPSGAFAILFPSQHILTHQGQIALPPGEGFGPLYLRCTDINGFRFAGQAHDSLNPAAWEWNGAWTPLPPPCNGVSPLIYDRTGLLHLSDGHVGSQGYRYVTPENVLISGDATYGPFHGLSEWTDLGYGLYLGQAHDDPLAALVAERTFATDGTEVWTLRTVEGGACRFIRANCDGEKVAIGLVKPDGAVIIHTTMAELRTLPLVIDSLPPAIPPPATPPPVEPPPVSDYLEINKRIRAGFPTPLGALHGYYLIALAQAVGGKLYRKDGGDHVTLYTGDNVSQDIVIVEPQWVDVLGDAENTAVPIWDAHPNATGPYVEVAGLRTSPAGAPPSQPPVTPPPSGGLAAAIAALEARVLALEQKPEPDIPATLLLEVNERIDALDTRVEKVETRTFTATGTTSRDYGHSHRINVTLVPVP